MNCCHFKIEGEGVHMIIGGETYYYGAYLEKKGFDRKHILEKEKYDLVSLKSIHNFS